MTQQPVLPHALAAPASNFPTLADFYQQIWWLVLLKVVDRLRLPDAHDDVHDLGGAPGHRPDAEARRARTGPARSGCCSR